MIWMNDFTSEPEELSRQELAAIERGLRSGRFILEMKYSSSRKVGQNFAARDSASESPIEWKPSNSACALDVGPGDEVITTPMTAIATVMAIIQAGATPALADINPTTALLDLASVERCLMPQTKAVLLVHLYGWVREMERWMTFCKKATIHLLEDCAEAHGAVWARQHAGVFGAWGAFSFYPTKNLGAKGDAGALVANSAEIASRVFCKVLRSGGPLGIFLLQRCNHPFGPLIFAIYSRHIFDPFPKCSLHLISYD